MCCRSPSCPIHTPALCRPHRRASRAQPGATRSGERTRRRLCTHEVEVSISSDEQWRGQEQAKHTHRSLTASDYPSCCPDGDNRDAVQDAWSASATMVSDERREVKWNSDGPSKLSHSHGQMPMSQRVEAGEVFSAEELTRDRGCGAQALGSSSGAARCR